jgi:protein O-mannosyl-transferase
MPTYIFLYFRQQVLLYADSEPLRVVKVMDQIASRIDRPAKEQRSNVAPRRLLLWAACIIFVTLAVYGPALRDGFVWDDLQNITDNQSLRSWDGLKQIWSNARASYQYYPLTYSSFWIEYHLWGLRPVGYHLVNVLLHALNALLLGILLSQLSVPGAWLTVLIFAVHPVHVESVAWITERKNVLSVAFCLASFLAWLRFTTAVKHRWRWYVLSLVLFVCALLSKTAAIVLPVAIVLVLWWKLERMRPAEAALLLPFFLIGAVLGLLTVRVEVHQVGAQGPEWAMTLAERMLIAGRAVWFYAAKLLWP